MPCRDYDDNPGAERAAAELRLNAATRAACEMARVIEAGGGLKTLSLTTQRWIAAHKEMDKRRIAAEEAERIRKEQRKDALKKLTNREKALLGLRE